jgi:hypothetical protein
VQAFRPASQFLEAVLADVHRTDATCHRHLPALGGSVYFIEGRSTVGCKRLLANGQLEARAKTHGRREFDVQHSAWLVVLRLR